MRPRTLVRRALARMRRPRLRSLVSLRKTNAVSFDLLGFDLGFGVDSRPAGADLHLRWGKKQTLSQKNTLHLKSALFTAKRTFWWSFVEFDELGVEFSDSW